MSYLSIIKNGIMKENPTFVLMLGMCPTLATTTSAINGMSMGLATMAVLICTNFVISCIKKVTPDMVRIPVFIVVIAAFVTILQMDHLCTMPGVDKQSATSIIAEMGVNMSVFQKDANLVGWAGFNPRNDMSNGKVKSRSITHGNKYLRNTMIQCAWSASRTQNCFFSKFSYHQTVIRKKSGQKIVVAIARKMLVATWHMLTDDADYADYNQDCINPAENGV